MRNSALHAICTLLTPTILLLGVEASAMLDPSMEGAVACSSAECMFRGNPQASDAISSLQRLPRMQNINEYKDNKRQVSNRSIETQFSPIGELVSDRVVTERIGKGAAAKTVSFNMQGTAFLVSPCYILTAAHVVFGEGQQPRPGVDYTMNFAVGVGSRNGFSGSVKAVPDLSLTSITGQTDWTLLKLEDKKCLGILPQVGYLEASTKKLEVGDKLVAAGYGYLPGEAPGTLTRSGGAVKSNDRDGLYQFSGSFVKGASGGPALTVENGVMKAAGLITSQQDASGSQMYSTFSSKAANNIQSIDAILSNPAVKASLDADKARFGNVNPASERSARPLPGLPTTSA